MYKITLLFTCMTALLLASSCTKYVMPIENFKTQFSKIDSNKLDVVHISDAVGPLVELCSYKANSIKTIECLNKYSHPIEIKSNPSTEIIFTYGIKKQRAVFYFDTVFMEGNDVYGVQSRIPPC